MQDKYKSALISFDDVKERMTFTHEIKQCLIKVKTGVWKSLYISEDEGSYWIEEYPFSEMQGGGLSCLYLFENNDALNAFDTAPYLTNLLRKKSENQIFWGLIGNDLGSEKCRQEGCNSNRIKVGVLCKVHHYENIKQEPCPF